MKKTLFMLCITIVIYFQVQLCKCFSVGLKWLWIKLEFPEKTNKSKKKEMGEYLTVKTVVVQSLFFVFSLKWKSSVIHVRSAMFELKLFQKKALSKIPPRTRFFSKKIFCGLHWKCVKCTVQFEYSRRSEILSSSSLRNYL